MVTLPSSLTYLIHQQRLFRGKPGLRNEGTLLAAYMLRRDTHIIDKIQLASTQDAIYTTRHSMLAMQ